jgi:hypothetical protein
MSTGVVSVPLLWIVPLSLYLLAFVVAFSRSGPAPGTMPLWTDDFSNILSVLRRD